MTPNMIGIIMLFSLLAILMLLRIPVAFSLGLSAVVTAIYLNIPLFNLYQKVAVGINSFTFMSVPFFIIMAQIMCDGEITQRLMSFCNVIVGRVRGGTAVVNILVSMLFGGISGSSSADVSSIGAMIIPSMVKEGYDPGYSVAVTVTSSVQGVIIPPSQNMIFYAVAAASGLSITKLFMCGYIPGILLGLALMIPAVLIACKRRYPLSPKTGWRENLRIIRDALIGLGAIVIIIGGTVGGLCTATEAAGLAAVYALIVTMFVYKTMTIPKFLKGVASCLSSLAIVMAIVMASAAFSYVLAYLKVPRYLTALLLGLTQNATLLMLLLIVLMLVLGCFMDMGTLILLLTPILYPVAINLGYDPYHFGIILVLALGIGLCTPPVGTSLFIGCSIAKQPIEKVLRDFIPFYAAMVVCLLLILFVPSLCTWLPQTLGM